MTYVVGTQNSNGTELDIYEDLPKALDQVQSLLEDGFGPDEIVVIHGARKAVTATTRTIVDTYAIT